MPLALASGESWLMRIILDYLTRIMAAFTLLVACVGVVLASVSMWSTQRSSRLSLGIEVLLRLDERFDSKRVRCARSRAAAEKYTASVGQDNPAT
jgi:hypothetical protein